MGTVGVDKASAQVYNLFPTPMYHHTGFLGHRSYCHCFKVFLVSVFQHLVNVAG